MIINSGDKCIFCGGVGKYAYRVNGYSIHRCQSCGVIGTKDMPTEQELVEYYQGFSFQDNALDFEHINTILWMGYGPTPAFMGHFKSITPIHFHQDS